MSRTRLQTRPDRPRSTGTRARIVEATATTMRDRGFVGTTTAAIASQAGVTEGSIFYHFSSLPVLFVEVLEVSSSDRLEAYRTTLNEISDPGDLLQAAVELFHADLASGHVTVLTEMIAGASAVDELRPLVAEHVEQWIEFVEDIISTQLAATVFAPLLPSPRQLAVLVVSMYTGAELLTGLASEVGAAEALADVAGLLAGLASNLGLTGPEAAT